MISVFIFYMCICILSAVFANRMGAYRTKNDGGLCRRVAPFQNSIGTSPSPYFIYDGFRKRPHYRSANYLSTSYNRALLFSSLSGMQI